MDDLIKVEKIKGAVCEQLDERLKDVVRDICDLNKPDGKDRKLVITVCVTPMSERRFSAVSVYSKAVLPETNRFSIGLVHHQVDNNMTTITMEDREQMDVFSAADEDAGEERHG